MAFKRPRYFHNRDPRCAPMLWMVLVPFANSAAINREIPALISGGTSSGSFFSCDLKSWPITVAVWVTQNDFGAHVNEFIYKKQSAFEHFLMNQYRFLELE